MRFEPGKVYVCDETETRILCVADTEWMTTIRRRMYYILLLGFDGYIPLTFHVSMWDYTAEDADHYRPVEE